MVDSGFDVPTSSDSETVLQLDYQQDYRFKYVILCLCLTLFLSAVEFISVSTVLPTIVADLNGSQFIWVTAAYALASAAIIPMIGDIAEIFGRKPTVLIVIFAFALGSAICGAAQNMTMLIIGRTVQGLGGGAIVVVTNVVLADMVPLQKRGVYGGLFGLTWCLAAALSTLIGGGLINGGHWRWLFYLNLPVCAISAILAAIFMKLPKPPGSLKSKLGRIDWIGNAIIIASSTSVSFALTDGGINFPWSSFHILVPLLVGIAGFGLFFVYEAVVAPYPLVPFHILNNRSSLSGYLQTFLHSIATVMTLYYIPVYFQGVKAKGPLASGVLTLGLTAIALFAALTGVSVKILRLYRPQIWFGWCLQLIGAGLFITIRFDNAKTIAFCILFGAGSGINYAAQYYPIQSSLPIDTNAQALSFHGFLRSFAAIWGVSVGGAILQNRLAQSLPPDVISQIGADHVGLLYPIIPRIGSFPEPLKGIVQQAFLDSLRPVWITITALSAAGLLSSLIMRDVPMHTFTDEKWNPALVASQGRETQPVRMSSIPRDWQAKDQLEMGHKEREGSEYTVVPLSESAAPLLE